MKKADLHVGDQVSFARMSNKALSLKGKIVKLHDDSECVDVLLEGTEGALETAHAEDVTVLEATKKKGAAKDDKDEEKDEPHSRARSAH
jgi:hypothetical protein